MLIKHTHNISLLPCLLREQLLSHRAFRMLMLPIAEKLTSRIWQEIIARVQFQLHEPVRACVVQERHVDSVDSSGKVEADKVAFRVFKLGQ